MAPCIGDGTHRKKRHAYPRAEGRTPIAKNITVTDDSGKLYEPTYFRRANGLVKHGRARWIDGNTLCLACPPATEETEDIPMDEKVFNYIREQIDYLKADLEREVPLNMDSEFQPEAAAKIYAMKHEMRRKLADLLGRLAGGEPDLDDKKRCREMLEQLAGDRASVDAAKEAVCEMDDDDCKTELMRDVCALYESSKKEIAAKLIEKLG